MEERYQVNTPENISFSFDIAGIGSRFMAALADLILYGIISVAAGIAVSFVLSRLDDLSVVPLVSAVYIGIDFLMYWGYYILFEIVWGGQSPGKRLLKLRVVRLDGAPASPGQIVIRNIARLVDIFPGFYAVGVIVMFMNDQSRRLGDLAAGTLVVRENTHVALSQLTPSLASVSLSDMAKQEAATLPLNRLSREQVQVVRLFLQRRGGMSDTQRAKLALEIGNAIARQMDVMAPSHPAQAEYLLELVEGTRSR